MSWPSGTKASTANVDQGGDKISLARADIKQNIDNTNDIIDTFNISSPSDGDLMQYSSSSGKWERVSTSSVSPFPYAQAILNYTGSRTSIQSDTYHLHHYEIIADPQGITSITNDYELNLSAGTYLFEYTGVLRGFSGAPPSPIYVSVPPLFTGDLDDSAGFLDDVTNGGANNYEDGLIFTLGNADKLYTRTPFGNNYNAQNNGFIRITKLA